MSQELQDLFEEYGGNSYFSVSNRPFVERRIQNLKSQFESLLKEISSTETYPLQTIIEEYSSKYPLDLFSNWFITWGQNLLHMYQKLQREKICDPSRKSGRVVKKRILFPNQSSSGDAPKEVENLKKVKQTKEEIQETGTLEQTQATIPQVDLSQDLSLIVPKTSHTIKKDFVADLHFRKNRNKRVEKSNDEEIKAENPRPEAPKKQPFPVQEVVEMNNNSEFLQEESGILKEFANEIWRIFSPL